MPIKVNLDALVPREDFDVRDDQDYNVSRSKDTLSINDLKKGEFFFSALRKPDFQRETNEWDAEKICDLIQSFLDGDLIPALILWRNAGGLTFVIDGSHRISALAAWINDDYGDGDISKQFYDSTIPEDQIAVAKKAKLLIDNKIGAFKDFQLATNYPEKVKPEIIRRAKSLGALAIQLQWVSGSSLKAESSFLKINQKASPIDPTELRILTSRKKPNALAARAIVRSGKGYKYWSEFSEENQIKIQTTATEVNDLLFNPKLNNPIKTLDLPIGGKAYSAQSLPLILDFINIVNSVTPKGEVDLQDDFDGSTTIRYLLNCRKVAWRINSNHPSSLGLHPIVYFYSGIGRHKPASFFAVTSLMLELEKNHAFAGFVQVREKFETLLLQHDYFSQQIVRKYRSASASYEHLKDFYLKCISLFAEGKTVNQIVDEINKYPEFNYLIRSAEEIEETTGNVFSKEVKSETFIKEALAGVLRCKICNGYIHMNSISVDHIVRKEDGGLGTRENAQLTHPYCNTTNA